MLNRVFGICTAFINERRLVKILSQLFINQRSFFNNIYIWLMKFNIILKAINLAIASQKFYLLARMR